MATKTETKTFARLIQGRETYAADLRNSRAYLTLSIAYTPGYCEGEYDETLGACGCTDYHMSDCPTRG